MKHSHWIVGCRFAGESLAILDEVARVYGVSIADLRGSCRIRDLAEARHVAFWLVSELLGYSLKRVGRIFGDRDHTTILHGLRKIEGLRNDRPAFARHLDRLCDRIEQRLAHDLSLALAAQGDFQHQLRHKGKGAPHQARSVI